MRFKLATRDDDAALRHILRMEALPGLISLATTREPNYFAAGDQLGREQAVIAYEGPQAGEHAAAALDSKAVGMCYWREHSVHVNGRSRTAHYLGGLRVLPSHQRRLSILKGGFAAVRQHGPQAPALWYTSIAVENANARRLLEAGLKGLPRYLPLGRVVTLAIPTARHRAVASAGYWVRVAPDQLQQWCDAHNQYAASADLSSAVDAAYIQKIGATPYAHWQDGAMVATLALWPQDTFKQLRVMRYGAPLKQLRPLVNAWARLTRGAPLPSSGHALDASFVAFWACAPALARSPGAMAQQLAAAAAVCPQAWLFAAVPACAASFSLGFLSRVRRYETMIYQVLFDGDEPLPPSDRPVWPEVSWL